MATCAVAVVAAVLAAATWAGAGADLPAGAPKCGETTCSPLTYCSLYDNHCRPCADLCDPQHRNHELDTCEKHCQAYIHDQRYVQKDADVIDQLKRRVSSLTAVAWAALGLALVLMVLVGVHVGRLLLRSHSHLLLWRIAKRPASASAPRPYANGKAKVGSSPEDCEAAAEAERKAGEAEGEGDPSPSPAALSRSVSRDVATPATTSTPLSRPRHPSEDTTLEYAYDNPALAPSPSPHTATGTSTNDTGAPLHQQMVLTGRKESSF